jgi:hypothetical protein
MFPNILSECQHLNPTWATVLYLEKTQHKKGMMEQFKV